MAGKKNLLKTTIELTQKQRSFVDILVENWGKISKVDAAKQAGYQSKKAEGPVETASRLTNPTLNPHVCRYLEKRLAQLEQKIGEAKNIINVTPEAIISK